MEILETFPRMFCFPKSRINENGGKMICHREILRPLDGDILLSSNCTCLVNVLFSEIVFFAFASDLVLETLLQLNGGSPGGR